MTIYKFDIKHQQGTYMRHKILTGLLIFMIMIFSAILIFIWQLTKKARFDIEQAKMNSTIEQVVSVIEQSIDNKETAISLFTEDYLNRINTLDYLINDQSNDISEKQWQDLLTIADVEDIYITDPTGTIIRSNDDGIIGHNIIDLIHEDNFQELMSTITAKGSSITQENGSLFMAAQNEEGFIIILAAKAPYLSDYLTTLELSNIIQSMPTEEYETIFVLDPKNGELLGISKNNLQELNYDRLIGEDEQVYNRADVRMINGKSCLVYAKDVDGMIIGIATETAAILRVAKQMMIYAIIFMFFVAIFVGLFIYRMISHIVLDDLVIMIDKMTAFCNGDKKIRFVAKKTKEMSLLSSKLNDVIKVIENQNERLSEVASFMGPTVGAYEYYPKLNQFFFSDNITALLGMDIASCKQQISEYYERYVQNCNDEHPSELTEEYMSKSGKYIRAMRNISKDALYAFVEDITQEMANVEALENKLRQEKYKNYLDGLTGLYNRAKIQQEVEQALKSENAKGALILMDIDNFKKVNDIKGHIQGDLLLKELAKIMQDHFRESDIKARLGGDEFMIFMPGEIQRQVLEKRLQKFFEQLHSQLLSYYEEFNMSVSMGIVYIKAQDKDFAQLYRLADEAMYEVKNKTKDGYHIAE